MSEINIRSPLLASMLELGRKITGDTKRQSTLTDWKIVEASGVANSKEVDNGAYYHIGRDKHGNCEICGVVFKDDCGRSEIVFAEGIEVTKLTDAEKWDNFETWDRVFPEVRRCRD